MAHSMVFTAVDLDTNNQPIKWRSENSWGDKKGKDGYCFMTDKWFDAYNFQVVLPINILSKKIQDILATTPVKLPPWDILKY